MIVHEYACWWMRVRLGASKLRLLVPCVAMLVTACASGPAPAEIASLPTPSTKAATAVREVTPRSAEAEPDATGVVTASPPEPAATTDPTATSAADPYAAMREKMVEEGIASAGIRDTAIIVAMRTVPRHEFVLREHLDQAYANHPLPIGNGQTISQPYIVALMTEAVQVKAGDKVLEIGTGSGYQAAVAATLAEHVYSVEIIGALADGAGERLARLGYDNVTVRHADGYFGWEEHAPFDAILVTAAPDHIPQPLVKQLKIGGRMVIPVGPVGGYQTLWLVTRVSDDDVRTEDLGGVIFVPLTRDK